MMSVPIDSSAEGRVVDAAVARTVAETFECWGFPSVRATHREHGKHVHAHIAVRADNECGDRLILDDRVCDLLRMTLAQNAQALGLRAEWTRRADRPEATESVLRGDLALQNNCSRADYRDRVDGIPPEFRQMARLAQRCPIWFDGFAAEYFQRVHKARTRGYHDRSTSKPKLPPLRILAN